MSGLSNLFLYGMPLGAIIFGAVVWLTAYRTSRSFDRKFGRESQATRDLFDRSSILDRDTSADGRR